MFSHHFNSLFDIYFEVLLSIQINRQVNIKEPYLKCDFYDRISSQNPFTINSIEELTHYTGEFFGNKTYIYNLLVSVNFCTPLQNVGQLYIGILCEASIQPHIAPTIHFMAVYHLWLSTNVFISGDKHNEPRVLLI